MDLTEQQLITASLAKIEIRDKLCGQVFYIGRYETEEDRKLVAEYWQQHKHQNCPITGKRQEVATV